MQKPKREDGMWRLDLGIDGKREEKRGIGRGREEKGKLKEILFVSVD